MNARTLIHATQGLAIAALASVTLSGCVVAPAGPYRAPPPYYGGGVAVAPAGVYVPPGVVYVAPSYPAPAVGYGWSHHPNYGWGWRHPNYGWHRGWR